MGYPRVLINTKIIEDNTKSLVSLAKRHNIEIAGVTKAFCAYPQIVEAYVKGGVKYLADSRIENLIKISHFNVQKIMLRLPMISEVDLLVNYADISLNSELETIKALSKAAIKKNKIHSIILMVDLGDLREGFYNVEELYIVVEEILKLNGVKLIGLGTNLTCYGGVIPNTEILERLACIGKTIEDRFNIQLEIISGGNSSTIHLLEENDLDGINNLRIGEALIFGTEPVYGDQIKGTNPKTFKLQAEIIEIKEKPTFPIGKIGKDAFGEIPVFIDKGIRKKIICAIGKQDVDLETLYPINKDLVILGGSSDHMIIDAGDSKINYTVGDIIEFDLHYVSLLRLMTSPYIEKVIID